MALIVGDSVYMWLGWKLVNDVGQDVCVINAVPNGSGARWQVDWVDGQSDYVESELQGRATVEQRLCSIHKEVPRPSWASTPDQPRDKRARSA